MNHETNEKIGVFKFEIPATICRRQNQKKKPPCQNLTGLFSRKLFFNPINPFEAPARYTFIFGTELKKKILSM